MPTPSPARAALIASIGSELVRFQDASNALDDAAAAVLALERADLQCVSTLLFAGPQPVAALIALQRLPVRAGRAMVERLERAGYARRVPGAPEQLELTAHARAWVETLWGPLAAAGAELMERESNRDLAQMERFLRLMRPVHEEHGARIRAMLDSPVARPRANRLRGGLSPAALRRVQLFVEANLARAIHLEDLAARAGLSTFYFARAFKASTGTTPRLFLEQRRLARATSLLRESKLPLAEVAAASGLGSQSRFTTTFRRATGFTPAAFRRFAED